MADLSKIPSINRVIQQFFDANPSVEQIHAKDLAPYLIRAGLINDIKSKESGIRKYLRTLDENNCLHLIPNIYPDRKASNTTWYFLRGAGQSQVTKHSTQSYKSSNKTKRAKRQKDEHYVIDLLDEVLNEIAIRQKTFDFLLGDVNKKGFRKKLPVDAYYKKINLVIEFMEVQHDNPVAFFDKPGKITVSGVDRREQRNIYDLRKMVVIPAYGINFLRIHYNLFLCNRKNRIIRDKDENVKVLKAYLTTNLPQLLQK